MVAAPAFLAVTTPLELTVATFLLLEDHLSVFTAVDGAIDAVTLDVLPLSRARVAELNVILVGRLGSTLTAAYATYAGTTSRNSTVTIINASFLNICLRIISSLLSPWGCRFELFQFYYKFSSSTSAIPLFN